MWLQEWLVEQMDGEINDSIVRAAQTHRHILCVFHFYFCIFMHTSAGRNHMSCGHNLRAHWPETSAVLFRHTPLCSMSLPSPNRFFLYSPDLYPRAPAMFIQSQSGDVTFCVPKITQGLQRAKIPLLVFFMKTFLSSLTCPLKYNAASILSNCLIA